MWGVISTILLAFAPSYAAAQAATCLAGFDWTYNSLGQSPCYVASALSDVCDPGEEPLPAIPDSTYFYIGPTIQNQNPCVCSSVYYSMLSACGVCQNSMLLKWSVYSTNCTRVPVSLETFPSPLPAGVHVPHYAYLDVTTIDGFDKNAAQAAGGTESVRPSATSSPIQTTTASSMPSVSASPVQTSGKKSNGGVIAGGVIGGVAVLGISIGLVVWLLLRRKAAPTTFAPQSPTFMPQSPGQMSFTSDLKLSPQQQQYNSFPSSFSGNQSPPPFQPPSTPQQSFHPGSPEV